MSPAPQRSRGPRPNDSGYALLLVIFLVASMLLLAAVATPRVLTEGKRENEAEAVWRGKQYTRAIRLYFQKNGRYPAALEDLSKPDAVGNHYLRKAYKDPTNPVDGKWRLIYVSPSGQLIGSVNYYSLQDMAAKLGLGISAGAGLNPLQPQTGGGANVSQTAGADAQQASAQAAASPFGQGGQPGQTPPGQTAQQGQANQPPGQGSSQTSSGFGQTSGFGQSTGFGQPTSVGQLQPVDGPVFGGSVIGVAGKTKKDSVMVYDGADNYSKWEFIFNPLTLGGAAGQPGTAPAANPQGATIAPGAGATTGTFGIPGASGFGMGMGAGAPTQPPPPTQPAPQQ